MFWTEEDAKITHAIREALNDPEFISELTTKYHIMNYAEDAFFNGEKTICGHDTTTAREEAIIQFNQMAHTAPVPVDRLDLLTILDAANKLNPDDPLTGCADPYRDLLEN